MFSRRNVLQSIRVVTALTACLFVMWSGKKKRLAFAVALGIFCTGGLFLGCGGGNSFAGGGGGGGVPSPTTTTVTSSAAKVGLFTQVTFTATVTGTGQPTGTVSFVNNGTTMGQATLANGMATFSMQFGSPGVYPIIAQYGGDNGHAASTSAAFTQAVTGSGLLAIVGQTGTLVHTANIQVTIQ